MNYREIDLNLLLILDAMYDTGSTTLVAERLKVSQPTSSFSLGKLRDVFGDELFVRHGASMQPTPLAEFNSSNPVRRVIETVRFDILRERAFDPARRRANVFALGLRHRRTGVPAAPAGAAHGQRAEAEPALADHAAGRVARGHDHRRGRLAIGYFPDLTGAGFFQQKLFEHAFTCLVRADHPVIGGRISMKQFLAADHVVVMQEGRSQEIAERRMAEMGGAAISCCGRRTS